jgi:acetoin utilization protein AcuC
MKPAFVFTEKMLEYDYGFQHPLQVSRLRLARDLIRAYGMLDDKQVLLGEPQRADKKDLLRFHTEKYLGILEKANAGVKFRGLEFYGIGTGDNPVFQGLYDWSCLVVGASLHAAHLVADETANVAFSIGGGLHHARKDRAAGFCYVNDPVLVIMYLVDRGHRVAYVDVDAHHGDGVQWAFYDTDQVLTISLHQDGRTLFPGTGGVEEMGRDAGRGYSVNVPLWPGTDDWLYLRAFDEVVEPLVLTFRPDVIVTQLGVDTFHGDPLASLDLTTQGFVRIVERLKRLCPRWVALGGGGYELLNVARAWTLAWGVMIDRVPEDRIPSDFLETMRQYGYQRDTLRDEYFWPTLRREAAEEALDTVLRRIRQTILPLHGL